MKKSILALLLALSLVFSFASCSGGEETAAVTPSDRSELSAGMDFTLSKSDQKASFDLDGAAVVTLGENTQVSGEGVSVEENTVTITSAGTYRLSGKLSGRITVDAGKEDKVVLVLEGVGVTSSDGPALFVNSADKVFLNAAKGTVNTFADAANYTFTSSESNPDAAIFSREDLTLNGEGEIRVTGNYKHGVVSKDDLAVHGVALNVTSVKSGIEANDSVKIANAAVTVTSGTDGIRATLEGDAKKGFVYFENSAVTVTAGTDGIQAETVLKIASGAFSLKTGGGSANASTSSGWGRWGGQNASSADSDSAKGLKAGVALWIDGGAFTVDSSDDCLHSDGEIQITAGTLSLSSGDDGVHADSKLSITDGEITVTKSYEGLESANVLVAGGVIRVTASDDGVNAAGGADSSALSARPGRGKFSQSTGAIEISGGTLRIDAAGDGVDSNGTLTLSGGLVLISGPQDNGNSALDFETGASVSGGTLIALGMSGMQENFTSAEQGAIFVTFQTLTGSSISVADANGDLIASFTPSQKSYNSALITSPALVKGGSYTVLAGAAVSPDGFGYASGGAVSGGTTLASVTLDSLLYGQGSGFGPGGGQGGPGGRPPEGRSAVMSSAPAERYER